MIKIVDDYDCCGCGACKQICPHFAIELIPNSQGFLYPQVNIDICINCSLCEKVCPVLNQNNISHPLGVYAAINPNDDIRMQSSSGGIFTSLAEKIIDGGGVVFGARFNEKWEVVHDYAETKDGLAPFRGSKYVQSKIGTTFQETEAFLKAGRTVLFSGTSCQIAGLKKFLRKDYDGLLTVDIVCHGAPSPMLWHDYLSTLKDIFPVTSVNMKDKTVGWMGYKITIQGEKGICSERATVNKYMLAFLQNLSLRPSCYQCPAKAGKSGSDITLADYWGVEKLLPAMHDNKGTSFVCVNTSKGQAVLESLPLDKEKANYDASVLYNTCIVTSTSEPVQRSVFWKEYEESGVSVLQTLEPNKPNIIKRALRWLERRIK